MTLTIEIPDVRVDDVRALARARGQHIGDFAADAILAAVDNQEEWEFSVTEKTGGSEEPDLDIIIAEAVQLDARGERGVSLEEAITTIRSRFVERA